MKTILEQIERAFPGATDDDLLVFLTHLYNTALPSPSDSNDFTHYDKEESGKTRSWDKYVGDIENQGLYPRCVGQSWEVFARVMTNKARGVDYTQGSKMVDYDAQAFYLACKKVDGIPNLPGTYPITGAKVMRSTGIVENRPQKGEKFTIDKYWRCKNVKETANDILTTAPVTLTIKIFPSFWTCKGVLEKPVGESRGLHNVCATKRGDGYIRFVNSHGYESGELGRFILPDELYRDYVTEAICGK